ncbi:hypothetical protein FPHYL_3198 [Fusarium phyllophilum]|uniref:Uncharacterized protein n=1 Tax=Fusarium phyllophilum TaxID=47803 RepID=A0A8H5NIA3_9HYPO|nr:hypothetical protein FPHYL_3198 [Fusarium phyllophilum]
MALNNDLNLKAGLDTVTQDEHDDITSTFEALADAEAASDSTSVLADGADFGSNNLIDNVFYVNIRPNTESLKDSWRQGLKSVTENVDLSSGFFNTRAVKSLNDTVARGEISDKDEIKKANYFAKVINHLVGQAPCVNIKCPRIGTVAVNSQDKRFTTKKEDFHKALISHFTAGLNLPSDILDKFEGLLTNIQNTIKNSPASSWDSIFIYIHVVIYVKDEVLQQWRPYIRTIYFKPSQDLSTYVKDKNNKGAGSEVNVEFQYVQFEGAFNNDLFESVAKTPLLQVQQGATTIKPLNITFNSN